MLEPPEEIGRLFFPDEPEFGDLVFHAISVYVRDSLDEGASAVHPFSAERLDLVLDAGQNVEGYSDETKDRMRTYLEAGLSDGKARLAVFSAYTPGLDN